MINFIDILLLLIGLSSVYSGWNHGFISGMLNLITWMGSLLLGLRFYPQMAGLLRSIVDWSEVWLLPVSFFIVTMLASILLHYIGLLMLRKLSPSIHSRKLNQTLGILPGLLNGIITVTIVAVLLFYLPLPESMGKSVQNSMLVNRLAAGSDLVATSLIPVFEKATEQA